MRITDVDPLDFDLIFERFLNPERVSLPDIDVDFCERRRGEVIEYVTRKYGRENVAQIITFGTMKAKAVVRDVGRALDMPYADVDRIAKQIPAALDMTLDKALAENPVLKEMAGKDPKVKEVLDVGRRLEGMSRHASVHAAGVVIAPGADHRLRAALQGGARRNHHAVEHEGSRAGRAAQDGLPGAEHADAHPRLPDRDCPHRRRDDRHRQPAAGRPGHLPGVRGRRDLRHLPVRERGHARAAAQGEARAPRRPDRPQRALPARAAEVGDGGRLGVAQAGPHGDQVRAASARSHPVGHLRRHRLPGAGDAHRAGAGGIQPRAGRRAAQGHGQEGPQGHGQAARGVHDRRARHRGQPRRRPPRSST